MPEHTNIKQVVFDFDGTLCKTDDAIVHCIKRAVQELSGSPSTHSDSRLRVLIGTGITLSETFIQLGIGADDIGQYVSAYREIYKAEAEKYVSLYPGVEQTLATLKGAGKVLVVLSNKGHQAVCRTIEQFGITNNIDLIVGEVSGIKGKPDPEVYQKVIAPQLKLTDSSSLIMVGDTSADIAFARNIGAKSCWVTYGFGEPKSCRELKPDFTIAQISELGHILLGRQILQDHSRHIPRSR